MSKTTSKRGRGRPRNPALDALQNELAVSRRRAAAVLRDMKTTPQAGSVNSEKSVSPLAQARLEKVLKECRFLEARIRVVELEQRQLENELLHLDDAIDLVRAAICPFADSLKRMPKFLAPRLVGQSLGQIEDTLVEEVNRLLKLGDHGLKTAIAKGGRKI